jgi:hypothetical protein
MATKEKLLTILGAKLTDYEYNAKQYALDYIQSNPPDESIKHTSLMWLTRYHAMKEAYDVVAANL